MEDFWDFFYEDPWEPSVDSNSLGAFSDLAKYLLEDT